MSRQFKKLSYLLIPLIFTYPLVLYGVHLKTGWEDEQKIVGEQHIAIRNRMTYNSIVPAGVLRFMPASMRQYANRVVAIDLTRCEIDESLLEAVQSFENIVHIEFAKTEVNGEMLAQLRDLKQLSFIGLSDTSVDDYEIEVLSSFSKLEAIDLSYTDVSDYAVSMLYKFKKLSTVILDSTNVSSEVLLDLSEQESSLRWLFLNNVNISVSVKPAMEALNPKLHVIQRGYLIMKHDDKMHPKLAEILWPHVN